jgi:uncharacterized protein (TIGR02001 family)
VQDQSSIKNYSNAYTESKYYKDGGSLELDLYGGYRYTFGSGIGIDIGALQYYYPGTRNKAYAQANTTEVYGAISYGWLQAKLSEVVSNSAWGWGPVGSNSKTSSARGTYYAELNATIPIGDLVGGDLLKGVTGIVHVARQDFSAGSFIDDATYNDYKVGLQKSFDNGVNVGGYWTKANTEDKMWTLQGKNIGDSTGTVYVQKTF